MVDRITDQSLFDHNIAEARPLRLIRRRDSRGSCTDNQKVMHFRVFGVHRQIFRSELSCFRESASIRDISPTRLSSSKPSAYLHLTHVTSRPEDRSVLHARQAVTG